MHPLEYQDGSMHAYSPALCGSDVVLCTTCSWRCPKSQSMNTDGTECGVVHYVLHDSTSISYGYGMATGSAATAIPLPLM